MPTHDVENTNGTNKGRDLFLANKPLDYYFLRNRKDAVKDSEAPGN